MQGPSLLGSTPPKTFLETPLTRNSSAHASVTRLSVQIDSALSTLTQMHAAARPLLILAREDSFVTLSTKTSWIFRLLSPNIFIETSLPLFVALCKAYRLVLALFLDVTRSAYDLYLIHQPHCSFSKCADGAITCSLQFPSSTSLESPLKSGKMRALSAYVTYPSPPIKRLLKCAVTYTPPPPTQQTDWPAAESQNTLNTRVLSACLASIKGLLNRYPKAKQPYMTQAHNIPPLEQRRVCTPRSSTLHNAQCIKQIEFCLSVQAPHEAFRFLEQITSPMLKAEYKQKINSSYEKYCEKAVNYYLYVSKRPCHERLGMAIEYAKCIASETLRMKCIKEIAPVHDIYYTRKINRHVEENNLYSATELAKKLLNPTLKKKWLAILISACRKARSDSLDSLSSSGFNSRGSWTSRASRSSMTDSDA